MGQNYSKGGEDEGIGTWMKFDLPIAIPVDNFTVPNRLPLNLFETIQTIIYSHDPNRN